MSNYYNYDYTVDCAGCRGTNDCDCDTLYDDEDECPGCGGIRRCYCDGLFHDDDNGPLDSDYGDSESDHVWADLKRSESY